MAKRELLEIIVDEISLVDDPAVQEDFILVKNQSGSVEDESSTEPHEGSNEVVPTEKQPDEELPSEEQEEETKEALLPIHEALVKEMLGAMAEAGKQIWATAPSLDLTDKEAMKLFKEKVWAIEDICWQLQNYKDVISLAKVAKEKAGTGDANGALDAVAKILTTIGKNEKNKEENRKEDEMPEGLNQGQVSRLAEGLQIICEALKDTTAGDISTMLQLFLGQGMEMPEAGAETEVEQGTHDEMTEAGKAEKSVLKELKGELEKTKRKLAKLEQKDAERSGTIQPPNGLNNEVTPTTSDETVVWGSDLAASR